MLKLFWGLVVVLGFASFSVHATEGEEKKKEWHCEKKEKNGKTSHVEAKTKEECKKKGGLWSKPHEEEGHEHKEGDAHKHD